jgi:hypothetical protein
MVSKRKFYKRVFHVEVLSEYPISEEVDLSDIHYNITEGDASGRIAVEEQEELDGKAAAELLREHESDPSFFMLTEDGEDNKDYKDPEGYDPIGGGGGTGRSDLPYGQGGGGD